MTPTTLTDIQWINLNMLTAIRSGLQHDPAATCCKFGLDADQADHLRDLSLGELWSLVAQIGETTLFPPRADLVTLLCTPRALAGPLALVHSATSMAISS